MEVRPPVIGVSCYREGAEWGVWHKVAALLPQAYISAVAHAGGVPVLLPPLEDGPREAAEIVVGHLDGLVLAGGPDVEPARYGATEHPRTSTQPLRDAWELDLLDEALAAGLPVLAVCRGMQLLNVACGGTLTQHLPELVGHHGHRLTPGVYNRRDVKVDPLSRLGALLGEDMQVSCYHHQAVDVLGKGLHPVAWDPDGTIEAVERLDRPYVVGVQWHPEEDAADRRLFAELVRHASP